MGGIDNLEGKVKVYYFYLKVGLEKHIMAWNKKVLSIYNMFVSCNTYHTEATSLT